MGNGQPRRATSRKKWDVSTLDGLRACCDLVPPPDDPLALPVDGACWSWKGSKSNGYGQVAPPTKGGSKWVHIISMQLVGRHTEGMLTDHRCRNRSCCNPSHLEMVTPSQNVLRGKLAHLARGECKECGGSRISRTKRGLRCLDCLRANIREYYQRNPEAYEKVKRQNLERYHSRKMSEAAQCVTT